MQSMRAYWRERQLAFVFGVPALRTPDEVQAAIAETLAHPRAFRMRRDHLLWAVAALEARGVLRIGRRSVVTLGLLRRHLERSGGRVSAAALGQVLHRLRIAGMLVDAGRIPRGPGLPGRPARAMRLSEEARAELYIQRVQWAAQQANDEAKARRRSRR